MLDPLVYKKLSEFVYRHKLLSPLQSGFKPGHGIIAVLLKVTGDITKNKEDTKVTVLVSVDISNAFNSVSHDTLLSILR